MADGAISRYYNLAGLETMANSLADANGLRGQLNYPVNGPKLRRPTVK